MRPYKDEACVLDNFSEKDRQLKDVGFSAPSEGMKQIKFFKYYQVYTVS
jgi:hypothetical protein